MPHHIPPRFARWCSRGCKWRSFGARLYLGRLTRISRGTDIRALLSSRLRLTWTGRKLSRAQRHISRRPTQIPTRPQSATNDTRTNRLALNEARLHRLIRWGRQRRASAYTSSGNWHVLDGDCLERTGIAGEPRHLYRVFRVSRGDRRRHAHVAVQRHSNSKNVTLVSGSGRCRHRHRRAEYLFEPAKRCTWRCESTAKRLLRLGSTTNNGNHRHGGLATSGALKTTLPSYPSICFDSNAAVGARRRTFVTR